MNLIVAVEQAVEDELGVRVTLADEKAMSQRSSPFRTVGTLAAYVWRQLGERCAVAEPRVVVVTGTRKGIGRALAVHFLGRGDAVVGCSRQPADLEADGYWHLLDVGDEAAVRPPARCARLGGLHALINNAGVAAMNHALLTPMETVGRVLETNVTGTFLFCREAAKLLRSAPHARIVNVVASRSRCGSRARRSTRRPRRPSRR